MNILIVDDENIIRSGIKKLLTESVYTFDNIYDCSDGLQALEILNSKKIDILFTDIRMPQIDGITLSQKAKSIYHNIKIILITGYSDFEYMQSAIDIGIFSYLLKPVSSEQFYDTLDRVVASVFEQENNIYEEQFISNINDIFFNNLKNDQVQALYHDLFMNEMCKLVILRVISHKTYPLFETIKTIFNTSVNTYKLYDIHLVPSKKNKNDFFIIFHNVSKSKNTVIDNFIQSIKSKIATRTNSTVYALFSDEMKLCGSLFVHCSCAYDQRFFYPNETVFYYKTTESKPLISSIQEDVSHLDKSIREKDLKSISILLKKIFTKQKGEYNIRLVYFMVANTVICSLNKLNIVISDHDINNIFSGNVLDEMRNINELFVFFYTLISDNFDSDSFLDLPSTQIVQKIKNYVDRNYADDITEKELGASFYIHPAYLSQLFRKEVGVSFTTYLKDVRLNKACELLKDTDIPVAKISGMVGYQDNQYFHRIFKKKFGITPLDYRFSKV